LFITIQPVDSASGKTIKEVDFIKNQKQKKSGIKTGFFSIYFNGY